MNPTINKVTRRPRKPGSGRKRKHGAITSKDYAMQLQQLEREALDTTLTTQQRDALRKRKRSLKNRMSALKSRENKRSRLDQLEKTVQRLQLELVMLARENQALRQSQAPVGNIENNCDISTQKGSRTNTSEAENSVNEDGVYSSPSLSPSSPEKKETSKLVKPCTHNCGSALGDAMEDFALDIFDTLDSFEDFDSIEKHEEFVKGYSDVSRISTQFETDFFEDFDFVPAL